MTHLAGEVAGSPQLMDAAGVERATVRLAHEIVERHPGLDGVVLVGIPTRGVPLAHRLARQIAALGHPTPPVGELDPSAHRDDRPRLVSSAPALCGSDGAAAPGIDGAIVIVVDDVLYTGRTVRAALDALVDCGRPAAVEVLTLVDRGHRELPVRATYVGKNVPTAAGDRVSVRLREVDGADGAWLVSEVGR